MASLIINLTFKILPVEWSDWRNGTLEEVGKRTVTSLLTNNVVTKEAKSFPGPTISVNYLRGSICLEVVELEWKGKYETKGMPQMTRCSMASFIRIMSADRLTQFNPSNVQLYLVSFCCSKSYCWAICTARQVGISVFSSVGLMLCVLIEQRLHIWYLLKGTIVQYLQWSNEWSMSKLLIQKVVFKFDSSRHLHLWTIYVFSQWTGDSYSRSNL